MATLLRWRRHLPPTAWKAALATLAAVALCAWLYPRWFRGYYRFSRRLAHYFTACIGYVVLALVFVFVVTPLGLIMRLMGKDILKIKAWRTDTTGWQKAGESSPLDRIF